MKNVRNIRPIMKKECIQDGALNKETQEIEACEWWLTVAGNHPQTGEPLKDGKCGLIWIPIMLMENTKVTNEIGAAVESSRNEASRSMGELTAAIAGTAKLKALNNNG